MLFRSQTLRTPTSKTLTPDVSELIASCCDMALTFKVGKEKNLKIKSSEIFALRLAKNKIIRQFKYIDKSVLATRKPAAIPPKIAT